MQRLMERHAGSLILQEERAQLGRAVEREGRRKQVLAFADVAYEHRLAHHSQVEPRAIALDLAIERRLAISEGHLEAELRRVEVARRLDVGDERLRFHLG